MEFFHLNADSPLWLFLRELVHYITNILRALISFHPRSLRERVQVIVDEISGVIYPQLHFLNFHCKIIKIIILEIKFFIIDIFGFHFIHTLGIFTIIFGIIFGTIMLFKLFSRAAMAVAKKIGIFKSNGSGKDSITDDYEIVDEPTSCEVFPYRNHQTEKERIKERFDKDFLPKYGPMWRKAREAKKISVKDNVDTTDHNSSVASTDEGDLMIEMSRLTKVVEKALESMASSGRNDAGEDVSVPYSRNRSGTALAFAGYREGLTRELANAETETDSDVGESSGTEEEDIVLDTSDEEDVSSSGSFSSMFRALDHKHLQKSELFSDLRSGEIIDEIAIVRRRSKRR
jgi:hypothetical protein